MENKNESARIIKDIHTHLELGHCDEASKE